MLGTIFVWQQYLCGNKFRSVWYLDNRWYSSRTYRKWNRKVMIWMVKNTFVAEKELDCPKRKNKRGTQNWETKGHGPCWICVIYVKSWCKIRTCQCEVSLCLIGKAVLKCADKQITFLHCHGKSCAVFGYAEEKRVWLTFSLIKLPFWQCISKLVRMVELS